MAAATNLGGNTTLLFADQRKVGLDPDATPPGHISPPPRWATTLPSSRSRIYPGHPVSAGDPASRGLATYYLVFQKKVRLQVVL